MSAFLEVISAMCELGLFIISYPVLELFTVALGVCQKLFRMLLRTE